MSKQPQIERLVLSVEDGKPLSVISHEKGSPSQIDSLCTCDSDNDNHHPLCVVSHV
jgi:hypothetical protein